MTRLHLTSADWIDRAIEYAHRLADAADDYEATVYLAAALSAMLAAATYCVEGAQQ